MDEKRELLESLAEKIANGRNMIERLKSMEKVDGVDKLSRKIGQEIRFLEKVQSTGNAKKEHLQSTNLIHLNAVVDRLCTSKNPISVMKPFKFQKSRLEVDIVGASGASWMKIIARNPRALTLISLGNGEYGQKSVLDQAESYLKCATIHPHMYKPPEIIFHFAYGIEKPLAERLEQLGVVVEGKRILCDEYQDQEDRLESLKPIDPSDEPEESLKLCSLDRINCTGIKVLNLDVSTLLAYVTNMTNGHSCFKYKEPLLTMQAEWERMRPVKPILEELFRDKKLVTCRTAYDNFINIVDVIGGPCEALRAKELMQRVRVVEDISCGRIMDRLALGGRIKDRSRLVFATGENMESITVSANEGFVRAARMQGIECAVFLHEPRSLSEVKEGNAVRVEPS